jgi:prepilin-type N-terminal cleavage/methylation domain-containing protein
MNRMKKRIAGMLQTRKKLNQRGFTLLELLVVVAILAAVAGTAAIALKDTDARASAAAHVAMMDELNKGIQTYRVLQRNVLPDRFDSLMVSATPDMAGATAAEPLSILGFEVGVDGAVQGVLPVAVQENLVAGGITTLRYIDETAQPEGFVAGTADCANDNIQALVNSRTNNVVAGNVFLSEAANGCGYDVALGTDPINVLFWDGGSERLTGQPNPAGAASAYNAETNPVYLLTGIGPSSTLFDTNRIGGMTTVPVYRHVQPNEYNRFIAVWNVGTYGAAGAINVTDTAELVTIIDGALDTKEEELGEWDGTRSTI